MHFKCIIGANLLLNEKFSEKLSSEFWTVKYKGILYEIPILTIKPTCSTIELNRILNHSDNDVFVKKGDYLAQLMLNAAINPYIKYVSELTVISERNMKGFGSTTNFVSAQPEYVRVNHNEIILKETILSSEGDSRQERDDSVLINWEVFSTKMVEANKRENIPQFEQEEILKQKIYESNCKQMATLTILNLDDKVSLKNIIAMAQEEDDFIMVKEDVKRNQSSNFKITNDVLYKQGKSGNLLCAADILLPSLVYLIHTRMLHPSFNQTVDCFDAIFYNRYSRKYIKIQTQQCILCRYSNFRHKTYQLSEKRTFEATKPRMGYYVDVLDMPSSTLYSKLLVCMCAYSRYLTAFSLKNATIDEIYKGLLSLFNVYGPAEFLYSDSDQSIIGAVAKL